MVGAAGAAGGLLAAGLGCSGRAGELLPEPAFCTERMALPGAGLEGEAATRGVLPAFRRLRILPASDSLIELL